MMEATTAKLRDLRLPLLLFAAALVIGLIATTLVQHPDNDPASRYIPMIREMAAGNWDRAFHPRIQPLFILVGAGFASLGLTPFAAAKAASVLFYALTVFPAYWLYRRFFAPREMLWGLLYCLSFPYLLRYSLVGLRDSANTFFIVCLAVGLVAFYRDRRWTAVAGTALAAAGMTLTRGESVVHAGLGLALLAGMALLAPAADRRRDLAKVAGGILLFAIAISPWVIYCQRTTGWPVTAAQEIPALRKLEQISGIRLHGETRLPEHETIRLAASPAAPVLSSPQQEQESATATPKHSLFSFKETLGVIPFYLTLAAAGMLLRRRRGAWSKGESLLLGLFIGIEMIIICLVCGTGGDYLGKRYLGGAMPLVLGWAGVAMTALWAWIQQTLASPLWRWPALLACVVSLTSGTWDGLTPARWGLTPKKQERWKGEIEAAAWIQKHRTEQIASGDTPLASTLLVYHNGQMPILFGGKAASRIAGLSGADMLVPEKGSIWDLETLRGHARTTRLHFLIWNRELACICPELQDPERLPPDLVICGRWGSGKYPIIILGFRPEKKGGDSK